MDNFFNKYLLWSVHGEEPKRMSLEDAVKLDEPEGTVGLAISASFLNQLLLRLKESKPLKLK